MRKFKIFSFIYLIGIIFFSKISFAAVWSNELAQSKENTNVIMSFFSTWLLLNILFATLVIILTVILARVASSRIWSYIENGWDWDWTWREELAWMLTRVVNISILSIWVMSSLTILWVDMWIFMWGLWFGIGFTLKIFLTNFISWILIVTQGFYHLWDIIEVWWRIWKIKKINALFTAIEQFDGVIFYVPNVKFLEEDIVNFHTNDKRRVEVNIGVDYDTDILKAKKIMLQVVEKFPNILVAPSPNVLVTEMADSSINLSLKFWINSKDWYAWIHSNVMETINLAFKQSWIEIPFPQMVISSRDNTSIKMA